MEKQTIYPESLIMDPKDGTIGLGEIYTTAGGSIRMRLVNQHSKRDIAVEDAQTHKGDINAEFANWLEQRYRISLEPTDNNRFKVLHPPQPNAQS